MSDTLKFFVETFCCFREKIGCDFFLDYEIFKNSTLQSNKQMYLNRKPTRHANLFYLR